LNVDDNVPSIGVGQKDGHYVVGAANKSKEDCTLSLHFWRGAEPGGFEFPRRGDSWVGIELEKGEMTIERKKGWRCPVVLFDGTGSIDSSGRIIEIRMTNGEPRVTYRPLDGPPKDFPPVKFIVRPKSSKYEYGFDEGVKPWRRKRS